MTYSENSGDRSHSASLAGIAKAKCGPGGPHISSSGDRHYDQSTKSTRGVTVIMPRWWPISSSLRMASRPSGP